MDAGSWKLNARLEYIEEMLHKVKREERHRLLCGSPDHTTRCMNIDSQASDQQDQLPSSDQNLRTENSPHENFLPVSCRLNQDNATEFASRVACQSLTDEPISCRSSASDSTIPIPDFSTLKREVICLDNLSIRELQETFRATFGRETSVKDKLWLKRRITMGLTNSCDVSATNFIIKGKKLVAKKGNEESLFQMDSSKLEDCSQFSGPVTEAMNDDGTVPLIVLTNLEDQLVSSGKVFGRTNAEPDMKAEDLHMEQSPAKRLRKPTRRYIEELSEVEGREGSGRLISAVKNLVHSQLSLKQQARHVQDAVSAGTVVARKECLGGCSVLVPYVSRVRKGRPRQNVMDLMNYLPSDTGGKLVPEDPNTCTSWQDGDDVGERRIIEPTEHLPQDIHLDVGETEKESEKVIATCTGEHQQKIEHACIYSSGDNSDDYVEIVPTSKGGTRRKHHRAWTLSEVIKLVEGVSRYGAGRWSEIKRLAFASYSYRTSVDLKDKWRNLLRASLSQATPSKGEQRLTLSFAESLVWEGALSRIPCISLRDLCCNLLEFLMRIHKPQVGSSRKHTSMPIPAPILTRVRELAEKHSQATSEQSFDKLIPVVGAIQSVE
ncbi:hypothetical protein ACLOJK_025436 [Asimina triloba]